ncbi:cytochrome c [Caballeronia sp. LZ062]|nr:cytochrome c [Caballeronia sp. LZ050]MDR5869667.1 cytochrome c [Caballeronia sp. LZ062]
MDSNRDGAGHGKPPDAATRSGQTTAGAANNARSAADSNRDSAVPGKTSDAGTSPNRETAGAARNAGTAIDFDRDSAGPRRTSDAATSLNHDTAGPAKNARTAADANSDSAGPARTPDASTNPTRETAGAAKAPQSATSTANTANPEGARLYAAACASCHGITGEGSGDHFPSLVHDALTAALGSMDTSNLVLVILHGVNRETRDAPAFMPAFGASLLDENIAALSNYLTRQFGDPRATTRAEDVARLRSIAQ